MWLPANFWCLFGFGYSLPYLFAFSFYAFPFFLGFLLIFSRWDASPAIEHVDDAQVGAAMRDLESARIVLQNEILGLKNAGLREGVRYLKGGDRFEMRSRRGQELNQALLDTRSSLAAVTAQIENGRRPELLRYHAWQLAMTAWRNGRAFRLALLTSITGFLVSAALLELFVYHGQYSDLLVWNLYPRLIGRHIEVGSSVGWALGLATLSIARNRNRLVEDRSDFSEDDAESLDELLNSQSGAHAEIDAETVPNQDPYQVLNVSHNASIPEIKAAYRLAIGKCHPDTVANRSRSIRDAAETEAQLVNAAYDSIRIERGFN